MSKSVKILLGVFLVAIVGGGLYFSSSKSQKGALREIPNLEREREGSSKDVIELGNLVPPPQPQPPGQAPQPPPPPPAPAPQPPPPPPAPAPQPPPPPPLPDLFVLDPTATFAPEYRVVTYTGNLQSVNRFRVAAYDEALSLHRIGVICTGPAVSQASWAQHEIQLRQGSTILGSTTTGDCRAGVEIDIPAANRPVINAGTGLERDFVEFSIWYDTRDHNNLESQFEISRLYGASSPSTGRNWLCGSGGSSSVGEGGYYNSNLESCRGLPLAGNPVRSSARPDLNTVVNVAPSNPAGSAISISAPIRNQGNLAAGQSTTRFQILQNNIAVGNTQQTTQTGALAIGGSEQETFSWTTTQAGSYSAQVCSDSASSVTESDENNNCAYGNFLVTGGSNPPPPPPTPPQQRTRARIQRR